MIAFLGSLEGGLVATTVNPWYTSEEMSRQIMSCQPKILFCLVENYDVVKKACLLAQQPNIKIIAIKSKSGNQFSDGMINFDEISDPTG